MIAFLPELLILIAILNLSFLKNKFSELESKKVFYIAKAYLLISGIAAIVLYNHKIVISLGLLSSREIFVKTLVYVYSIFWFNLSYRWFANKTDNGLKFVILALFRIMCLLLLISTHNLIVIATLLSLLTLNSYSLLPLKRNIDATEIKTYKINYIIFLSLFWAGVFCINNNPNVSVVLMLPIVFYLLGVAPFHGGVVNLISNAILPTSGLIAIINILGYIVLLNFLIDSTFVNKDVLKTILQTFGCLSMIIGATYAITQTNLRKVLAYSSVFHLGVILTVLSIFDDAAKITVFIYVLIYTISVFGIFTSFYGLKLKGDYQKDLDNLSAVAHYRPFIITSFMLCLISVVGYPPLIGFVGRIGVINSLIINHQYWIVALFLITLMILMYAYLNILKVFYFAEPVNKKYDRVDFGVYLMLFINVTFLIVTLINPMFFTQYIQEVFNKI